MNYCYKCLHELEDNLIVCPNCGNDNNSSKYQAYHLVPGTTLNKRYYIGHAIGEGGFGITYAAIDILLNLKVAIKELYISSYMIRNNNNTSIEFREIQEDYRETIDILKKKYIDEARILSQFKEDEGIVGVKDYFEANGTAYIVMDYIEGVNLREYVKINGAFKVSDIINIMTPIFDSLAKVHKEGLIHRDISPENIMITFDGKLKLLDFGAAREFALAKTKSMTVVLKPGFAPIEQYISKGKQGPWTDVYSLCATIFFCVTGVLPDESLERLRGDSTSMYNKLKTCCSAHLREVIMKGMSVKSEDRYSSVEELKNAFSNHDDIISAFAQGKSISNIVKVSIVSVIILLLVFAVAIWNRFCKVSEKDSLCTDYGFQEDYDNKELQQNINDNEGINDEVLVDKSEYELDNLQEDVDRSYSSGYKYDYVYSYKKEYKYAKGKGCRYKIDEKDDNYIFEGNIINANAPDVHKVFAGGDDFNEWCLYNDKIIYLLEEKVFIYDNINSFSNLSFIEAFNAEELLGVYEDILVYHEKEDDGEWASKDSLVFVDIVNKQEINRINLNNLGINAAEHVETCYENNKIYMCFDPENEVDYARMNVDGSGIELIAKEDFPLYENNKLFEEVATYFDKLSDKVDFQGNSLSYQLRYIYKDIGVIDYKSSNDYLNNYDHFYSGEDTYIYLYDFQTGNGKFIETDKKLVGSVNNKIVFHGSSGTAVYDCDDRITSIDNVPIFEVPVEYLNLNKTLNFTVDPKVKQEEDIFKCTEDNNIYNENDIEISLENFLRDDNSYCLHDFTGEKRKFEIKIVNNRPDNYYSYVKFLINSIYVNGIELTRESADRSFSYIGSGEVLIRKYYVDWSEVEHIMNVTTGSIYSVGIGYKIDMDGEEEQSYFGVVCSDDYLGANYGDILKKAYGERTAEVEINNDEDIQSVDIYVKFNEEGFYIFAVGNTQYWISDFSMHVFINDKEINNTKYYPQKSINIPFGLAYLFECDKSERAMYNEFGIQKDEPYKISISINDSEERYTVFSK